VTILRPQVVADSPPPNELLRIWHEHHQSALTAAAFSVIAAMIYSWFRKLPYNQFAQAVAVCVFLAIVADVILLEWVKLPKVACVLIGAVAGFSGRPLIMAYIKRDEKIADSVLDRLPLGKKPDA
jgi:hypothetical protein